jgi:transcriptional regulator with XRE-family HTH domain
MDARTSLNKSFQMFDLKASEIAERAGVAPEIISRFRRGKGITVDTLDKIIQALPVEAKTYFGFLLVADIKETNSAA